MGVWVLVLLFFAWAVVDEFAPQLLGRFGGRFQRRLARWVAPKFAFAQRDPLAALGVGSAAVAFLLWALPVYCGTKFSFPVFYCEDFFSTERLTAIVALFALSVVLLLLRRR